MTTITPNIALTEPDFAATNWNIPLNLNFGILDAVQGTSTAISLTGVATPQTFIAAQYQSAILDFNGVLTGDFVYNFPTTVGGKWFVRNQTTGPYILQLGTNSQVVNIPADGTLYLVVCDTVVSPYIFIFPGSGIQSYAGNPNGNVPGRVGSALTNPASLIWDSTNKLIWICTTSGPATTAVWTAIGGTVTYNVGTPTALSGNVNDYSPAELVGNTVLRIGASAAWSISGIVAPTVSRKFVIENISAFNITLLDASANSAAANRFNFGFNYVLPSGQSITLWYDLNSTTWRQEGAPYNSPFSPPGFRLTLTSANPVLTTDVTGATTIFYTPYLNGYINLIGTNGQWYSILSAEMSQALSDATNSPAASVANSGYDLFVWSKAGIPVVSRGPPWASIVSGSSSRGTGAGTTQLVRSSGVLVNQFSISNGPAAGLGIYVGTVFTNSGNTVDWVANPAAAAGGGNARIAVWNMYNRVDVAATSKEAASTSWSTNNSTRSANASNNNRITTIAGFPEDTADVSVLVDLNLGSAGGVTYATGVGLNSTSALSGVAPGQQGTASPPGQLNVLASGFYKGLPTIGVCFYQWVESCNATGGTNVNAIGSGGITMMWRA